MSNQNKSSGSREWTHNEIIELIAIWKDEEALYNIKHRDCSIQQEINNDDTKQYWFLSIINHQLSEAVARRHSMKKVFLEVSQNSQENSCVRVSFLTKLQTSGLQLYQK